MDYSQLSENLSLWLHHYGSFALFGFLLLGIIAFPIPEETLLVLTGILIREGELSKAAIFAAYAGSMCGISVSYSIGRLTDKFFVKKYGSWVGLDQEKWELVHNYFQHYGTWMLFFGYFIPGVRHFTGFLVGITRLEYKQFAPFAYTGAFVWTSTFLFIGYFFGEHWKKMLETTNFTLTDIAITLAIIYAIYLLIKALLKK